jgi:hypothetical protein
MWRDLTLQRWGVEKKSEKSILDSRTLRILRAVAWTIYRFSIARQCERFRAHMGELMLAEIFEEEKITWRHVFGLQKTQHQIEFSGEQGM